MYNIPLGGTHRQVIFWVFLSTSKLFQLKLRIIFISELNKILVSFPNNDPIIHNVICSEPQPAYQSPCLHVCERFQQQEEEEEEAWFKEHKSGDVCVQLQGHLHGRGGGGEESINSK